jgi:putative acetyltransferase
LQEGIHPLGTVDYSQLVEVWEASVRATHHFLTEADIEFFRPLVRDEFLGMVTLAGRRDETGQVTGFVGVAQDKIEMLFVHPQWFGKGIGRDLTRYAIEVLGATAVDVNEQNEQAMGFYEKMGFEVTGRSATDAMGKPFPLLHLRLKPTHKP